MSANAMMEKIEDVTVLRHPMIFNCLCADRDTVPNGLHMYAGHLQGKREIRRGQCRANTE